MQQLKNVFCFPCYNISISCRCAILPWVWFPFKYHAFWKTNYSYLSPEKLSFISYYSFPAGWRFVPILTYQYQTWTLQKGNANQDHYMQNEVSAKDKKCHKNGHWNSNGFATCPDWQLIKLLFEHSKRDRVWKLGNAKKAMTGGLKSSRTSVCLQKT